MTKDERQTYWLLKRSIEKGYASPGQIRRFEDLDEKFQKSQRTQPILDEFDEVGAAFRKKYEDPKPDAMEQARALAEFDQTGRRDR